ncbi:tripartite tricarboxylate transporter substrate binding protein [Bosea sp. BK604]|uniref:Bug family tripartite tricarboxylate transporter substrate binding protein n=1 Tax=Bosea sp. BK604 TaxID=2512180 RepID=UPI0010445484|nr:tripartite tricarboxylate transporter substrate binding protein [Bosea sp. BK604]TCR62690.1 tripartite-type tricarboxylate transporter receptor subunit TctC [Bosea sp. BK604]
MRISRRSLIASALLAGLASSLAPAQAEDYPTKPLRIIVGFAAGGAPDALARIVAEKLNQRWGQPVTVENRVGAQGNTALAAVAKAEPDGYTLALMPVGNAAVNPALFASLPYDPVKDFAPITQLASVENVLVVSAQSPIKSAQDLIAQGRAKTASLTYASPGAGSMAHLAAELLARSAGFEMTHVPYRGVAPALTDVMRGDVTLIVAQLSTAKPLIDSGQLRALGIASRERSKVMPELPTIAEGTGIAGFEAVSWYALMAPAKTPDAVIGKLHGAITEALKVPEVVAAMAAQGAQPIGNSPAELAAVIAADTERWTKVIKEAGIQAN